MPSIQIATDEGAAIASNVSRNDSQQDMNKKKLWRGGEKLGSILCLLTVSLVGLISEGKHLSTVNRICPGQSEADVAGSEGWAEEGNVTE